MDRLHRYLGHGDSFHLWIVSVIELLRVELELWLLLEALGARRVWLRVAALMERPRPVWGRKLTAKAWTSRLPDPCSSSPKKDTFVGSPPAQSRVQHHLSTWILLQDIASPIPPTDGKPARGSTSISNSSQKHKQDGSLRREDHALQPRRPEEHLGRCAPQLPQQPRAEAVAHPDRRAARPGVLGLFCGGGLLPLGLQARLREHKVLHGRRRRRLLAAQHGPHAVDMAQGEGHRICGHRAEGRDGMCICP